MEVIILYITLYKCLILHFMSSWKKKKYLHECTHVVLGGQGQVFLWLGLHTWLDYMYRFKGGFKGRVGSTV